MDPEIRSLRAQVAKLEEAANCPGQRDAKRRQLGVSARFYSRFGANVVADGCSMNRGPEFCYGLRGVRVGEARNPGPTRRRTRQEKSRGGRFVVLSSER